ncbi:MAG: peptide-methionine (S)-S-oxide reductase [Puniceicoccaceae bacterium]|nr:MAG: peptide-methionine (S)-S-oxide reductase [Puniceicoccaceae bacterium]
MPLRPPFGLLALLLLALSGCDPEPAGSTDHSRTDPHPHAAPDGRAIAFLGAGCFWCIEAVLQRVDGVVSVDSGYMGGTTPDPTYRQVMTGRTGHAEVVRVIFDPEILAFTDLLDWFWRLHDPTTLNRQGADVGTQYRSAIFWTSPAERDAARDSLARADAAGRFRNPIVTEITPAGPFHRAEDYHQDYFRENPHSGYSRAVIAPKLDQLGLPPH